MHDAEQTSTESMENHLFTNPLPLNIWKVQKQVLQHEGGPHEGPRDT